jgi:hypothetical protein
MAYSKCRVGVRRLPYPNPNPRLNPNRLWPAISALLFPWAMAACVRP